MSTGPAIAPGGAQAAAPSDADWAARRRRRLMFVLTGTAVTLAAAAIIAVLLPAAPRERFLSAVLVSLVYVGAVPVMASLIQFMVIGFNRFYMGYERLQPFYPRVAIIVPAWNEAEVIGATIERLLAMEYPPASVRVYVVDDASTDETPDVVRAWEAREPDRVRHLRRERGGQGKAHTLNHGITQVLAEPWAEAVLIIDADVLFENSALRRMTRHLSNPQIGAVMGYIKEGSAAGNYLTRYIAYEYVTAQAAARRAQNVLGVMACLAGGAQLHSRESLIAIGGRIDTTTLAEDTVTTFRTQLAGKQVVFEPNAVVWAEEPGGLDGLWKQRLRWARGNVQISLQFANIWLHGRRFGRLGSGLFALIWFAVLLMPVCMAAASSGLIGLYLLNNPLAWQAFRWLWIFHLVTYLFVTTMSFVLDPHTARRAWVQGILFPGLISLSIFIYTAASGPLGMLLTSGLQGMGVPMTEGRLQLLQLFGYGWLTGSMLVAYSALWIQRRWRLELIPKILIQLAGYGSLLGAVTVAAYVREIQGAGLAWDKTVKTGKAVIPQ